jgi:hypothetical protein
VMLMSAWGMAVALMRKRRLASSRRSFMMQRMVAVVVEVD